jgi:hypothetical protein
MQGRHKPGKSGGVFHGYLCGRWNRDKGCSRNSVSEEVLLDQLALKLMKELDDKATLDHLRQELEAQRSGKGDTLRLALEKGRQHVVKLEEKVTAGAARLLAISADLIDVAEKELRRLRTELATAQADLGELEHQAASRTNDQVDIDQLLAQLADFPRLLRDAQPEKRAQVLRMAIARLTLRFCVRKSLKGRQMSRWTGATIELRGGDKPLQMSVAKGEANPTRKCSW